MGRLLLITEYYKGGGTKVKELAIKSMKLNRDLDRYVEQALEQGRPVKIG